MIEANNVLQSTNCKVTNLDPQIWLVEESTLIQIWVAQHY